MFELKSGARCRETADRRETFHAAHAGSGSRLPGAAGLIPLSARFGKHNPAQMRRKKVHPAGASGEVVARNMIVNSVSPLASDTFIFHGVPVQKSAAP